MVGNCDFEMGCLLSTIMGIGNDADRETILKIIAKTIEKMGMPAEQAAKPPAAEWMWVQRVIPKDIWKRPAHERKRIRDTHVPLPKTHMLPASTGKTAPPSPVPVVAAKWCNGCIRKPKRGSPHPQSVPVLTAKNKWSRYKPKGGTPHAKAPPARPFFRPRPWHPNLHPNRKLGKKAVADAVSVPNVDGHRFTIDMVAIDLSSFPGPMINSSSSRLSPSRG